MCNGYGAMEFRLHCSLCISSIEYSMGLSLILRKFYLLNQHLSTQFYYLVHMLLLPPSSTYKYLQKGVCIIADAFSFLEIV
jgi:hypothetical protein